MKICEVENCGIKMHAKGLCWRHYLIERRGRDPRKPKPISPLPKRYIQTWFNGKKGYLHRHIMEKCLGRKLKRSEHVHHKDGNIHNNAIENLSVMSAAEHLKHHIAELHPNNTNTHRKCPGCHKIISVTKFERVGKYYTRCRECKNAKQLAYYYKTKSHKASP